MAGHTVETYSGRFVNFDCLNPEQFIIDDIATHLANICRFGGAMDCAKWYSVAEHSVNVARVLADRGAHPDIIFGGLMHDAHEAYVGDITTPVKKMFGHTYKDIVALLDREISRKFDVKLNSAGIAEADQVMLAIEAWHLMPSGGEHVEWSGLPDVSPPVKALYQPRFWTPHVARKQFMEMWSSLSTRRHLQRTVGF